MDAHQETDRRIAEMVRACYWDRDINCARTPLYCMRRLFDLPLDPQLDHAAIGLNGAGRMGCQCGLLEGALLFLGIHASSLGKTEKEVCAVCGRYTAAFQKHFGGIDCRMLRPGGFQKGDPPHLCEGLTVEAVRLLHDFVAALR